MLEGPFENEAGLREGATDCGSDEGTIEGEADCGSDEGAAEEKDEVETGVVTSIPAWQLPAAALPK